MNNAFDAVVIVSINVRIDSQAFALDLFGCELN